LTKCGKSGIIERESTLWRTAVEKYLEKILRQRRLQKEEDDILKKLVASEQEQTELRARLKRVMDEKFVLRSEK
jgi:hypothetical protein